MQHGQRQAKQHRYLESRAFSLDAMLNPFGFTRHYNWDSPVGLNLYGGYELGQLQLVHTKYK